MIANSKLTQHQLSAEAVNDKHGPAIMLTQQDGIEDPHTVIVHPWQFRSVCEHFGIVAADEQGERTIATLQRRMLRLRERIDNLADWMANHSDHRHADLSYETTQLRALQDLADEWCAEFADNVRTDCGQSTDTEQPERNSPTQAGLPGL